MAEGFFRKAIQGSSELECIGSAGVAAYNGDKMSEETAHLLASAEVSLPHFSSRMVTADILQEATHIYAMTQSHLSTLVDAFPEFRSKCQLVCDHLPEDGGRGMDVPDPIGMGFSAYQQTGSVFAQAIPAIIAHLDHSS